MDSDVDKEGTYAEIVKDWAEPTVMLREAISNSLDANATHISIEVNIANYGVNWI